MWKRTILSTLALTALAIAEEEYNICPAGVSSSDVDVGAGNDFVFATQEEDRDRYRRNVDCTFNYRMNKDTCSKLSFECEEFRLNRGDYLSITTGTQTTTYKWRNRGEIILQEFSGDISVRFKSDGSRQGPGAYCWMWCSEEGSAPSTTESSPPSTSASTTSTTTSPSTTPPSTTTTESPVTTSSSGSGSGTGSSSGYTQAWLRGEGPSAHAHEGVRLADQSGWIAIGEGLLDDSNNQGVSRVLVRKADNAGATVWSRQLGDTVNSGNAYSVGYSVVEGSSALYAGVGLWSSSASQQQPAVVALNPSTGAVVWTTRLATGQSGHGGVRSCIMDGSNIVCVGYVGLAEPGFKFVADESRPAVWKLDSSGNVVSEQFLAIEGLGQLAKIRKDAGSGFIACTTGWGTLGGADVNVVALVKFSNSLSVEWSKTYGMAGGNSQVFDMLVDNDGNYLLGGHTTVGDGVVNWDYLALKVDSGTRNQVWRKTYGQPRNFDARYIHDEMYGVALDNAGNYLLLGGSGDEYTYSANGVGEWSGWKSDIWGSYLVVVSPDGTKLYENFYGDKEGNNAGEWLSYDPATGDIMVYADSDTAGGFGFLKLTPN